MGAKPVPASLIDLVRNRILSGAVGADLPIRQDALATELGVSKIPVREALARLEQEGLVRSEANRGFFVQPLTATEAEEVYALRLKLEPEAAARACRRADEDERGAANKALEALEQAIEGHGDAVGALNRNFHLALIRPGGQPVTANIVERLQILAERYVRMHLQPTGRDVRANEEHREMLAIWLARDAGRVEALTRAHIEKTLDDLRREFATGPEEAGSGE